MLFDVLSWNLCKLNYDFVYNFHQADILLIYIKKIPTFIGFSFVRFVYLMTLASEKVSINPLSPSSTYFITITGQAGTWGGSESQSTWCKLMNLTTDVQIGSDFRAIGFNHVGDAGVFEILGSLCMKERYQNHPDEEFELALIAWTSNPETGGGELMNVKMEVLEIE